MKDMGKLQYFFGIQVHRDRKNRHLQIHQCSYTNIILKRFNMENSSPVSTPMATDTSSANRLTNLRLQTKNSINRTLAAKCTTCSTPDPISHMQSRNSRNSRQIH